MSIIFQKAARSLMSDSEVRASIVEQSRKIANFIGGEEMRKPLEILNDDGFLSTRSTEELDEVFSWLREKLGDDDWLIKCQNARGKAQTFTAMPDGTYESDRFFLKQDKRVTGCGESVDCWVIWEKSPIWYDGDPVEHYAQTSLQDAIREANRINKNLTL